MLVLSRKLYEKIVFAGTHTAVQIVGIKGGVLRLGIEAPPEVAVLREELYDPAAEGGANAAPAESQLATFRRQFRNRLRDTGVGLGLLHLFLDVGEAEEAKATLQRIRDEFCILRYGVEGELMQASAPPPVPARKPLKALLVEDDRNERELLAGFLRMSGLEVDTAGDGGDALDYLRSRGRPDVVLLDMGMPRVDGPTTVREIRRDPAWAGLKVFGVTGHLPDEFDLESGPAGIDRWFHKPLDPSALVRDLDRELCRV
jgi:two-component system, OmpR family, response regulator